MLVACGFFSCAVVCVLYIAAIWISLRFGYHCAAKNAGVSACVLCGLVLRRLDLAFDRIDLYTGVELAMAGATSVVLAAVELLDEDLFAFL